MKDLTTAELMARIERDVLVLRKQLKHRPEMLPEVLTLFRGQPPRIKAIVKDILTKGM